MVRSSKISLVAILSLVLVSVGSSTAFAQGAKASTTYSGDGGGKSMNLRVSPLGLLLGSLNAELDIKVSDGWTLGPQAGFINLTIGDVTVNATSFGIRGTYYLGRPAITEGWYVSPYASYVNVKVTDRIGTETGEGTATGFGFGGLGGFQWLWDSFNINLGLGAALASVSNITVKTSSGQQETYDSRGAIGAGIAAEFTMGFAF